MADKGFKTDKQIKNRSTGSDRPWLWKKGQSGNIQGRPKGKTMKEYARELLQRQTEEERQAFLNGLPKEIIWKMAEGNPDNKNELVGTVAVNFDDTFNKVKKDVKTSSKASGNN